MARAADWAPRVTVSEFLSMRFEGDTRYELVNGRVAAKPLLTPVQSALIGSLAGSISDALSRRTGPVKRELPRPFTAVGIRSHFDAIHNLRIADLAVTDEGVDPHSQFLAEPILVAETFLPGTEAALRAKLHVYAAMPSVREILFLDSQSVRAELHRRDSDNLWPEAPQVLEGDDPLILEGAGLEMPLSDLYRGLGF